jgi:CheY-like chemotaxis protein
MSAPNRTIGIVDDDAAVRGALSRLVRAHGFAVRTFDSAEEFQAAAHLDTCLLIVDIDLSGASGLEQRTSPRQRRPSVGCPCLRLATPGRSSTTCSRPRSNRRRAATAPPFTHPLHLRVNVAFRPSV